MEHHEQLKLRNANRRHEPRDEKTLEKNQRKHLIGLKLGNTGPVAWPERRAVPKAKETFLTKSERNRRCFRQSPRK